MSLPPRDPQPQPVAGLSPLLVGLAGRCPRCGKGSMFKGFLSLAETCPACGFDLRFADPGDGPSFFASFIGGFLVLLVGVVLQVAYEPPIWVYLIVLLLGAFVCLGLIRIVKGVLVSLQYANKAGQGEVER